MMTLAGFAISYLARPLGAVVFGHYGGEMEQYTMTMILMTVTMFMMVFLPLWQALGMGWGAAHCVAMCY